MQEIDYIILANVGLVYHMLHRYHLVGDPEAESIGYEALYNAIKDYDSSRGTKLSTVATVYIYNALGSYVRRLNNKRRIQTISYNNLMNAPEDEEFIDLLPSDINIEADCIKQELLAHVRSTFDSKLERLTNEKHKKILKEWNESDFSAQTKDIATKVGVSQSYVSQVINSFKHKLRKELEAIYYD